MILVHVISLYCIPLFLLSLGYLLELVLTKKCDVNLR
jgi:surface polysaccharide O-acyltransferase-like enzyme